MKAAPRRRRFTSELQFLRLECRRLGRERERRERRAYQMHLANDALYGAAGRFADVFAEFTRGRATDEAVFDSHRNLIDVMQVVRDGQIEPPSPLTPADKEAE